MKTTLTIILLVSLKLNVMGASYIFSLMAKITVTCRANSALNVQPHNRLVKLRKSIFFKLIVIRRVFIIYS